MFLTKHLLKEHKCEFKIDKLIYSKSQCRTTYYFTKKSSLEKAKRILKDLTKAYFW